MNTPKKVILASACGAAIGYALTAHFLSGFWVILGIMIGAIAGWFLYDPAQFAKSFGTAVRSAILRMNSNVKSVCNENWGTISRKFGRLIIDLLIVAQIIGASLCNIIVLAALICGEDKIPIYTVLTTYTGISLFITFFLVAVIGIDLIDASGRERFIEDNRYPILKHPTKLFLLTNPLTISFTWTWHSLKVIGWLLRRMPIILHFCWIVAVKTCILAHSNGRLASSIGAAIGYIIGLCTGYIVVAMISGAFTGWFAYYFGGFFGEAYVAVLRSNLAAQRVRL